MNHKFFSIFLSFLFYFGVSYLSASYGQAGATETSTTIVSATDTSTSTSTTDTSTNTFTTILPYITDVIFDDNITISAGDIVQLSPKKVIWSDKIDREISINWAGEHINSQGQFSTTKVGIYTVNINISGIQKMVYVQVKPLQLSQVKINIKENPIYGKVYIKQNLFEFKGFDKYQNEVLIAPEDVKYNISKDSLGQIIIWVGSTTGNSQIDKILKLGNISSGNNIFFFERGTFTINVITVEGITAKSSIYVDFDDKYKGINAWQDYHLTNIDFDKKLVEVEFAVNDIKIPYKFDLPSIWIEKFNQPNFIDKLQVICWIHYKILEVREQVIQTQINSMFNELILKSIFQGLRK